VIRAEDICEAEWAEWYRLTPAERWAESEHELDATAVAVPPFEQAWLLKGHAVHFRCRADAAAGIRLDVMSTLRGVAPFPELWERRTTVETDEFAVELLSLPDLVAAKKTQRDKDWPMIRRLLEADYFRHRDAPSDMHVAFWLRELRTPELLQELVAARPADARAAASVRPLLGAALRDDLAGIERGLMEELEREREREISARTDIQALGCVLYEMSMGEPPFTGPTAQAIVAKVMTEAPHPLHLHRKSVTPEIEGAVLQALEKLPADRFASAADFAAALEGRLATRATIRSAPVTAATGRWRVATAAVALAAIAAAVPAGVGTWVELHDYSYSTIRTDRRFQQLLDRSRPTFLSTQ
jgi:hypothetical protein